MSRIPEGMEAVVGVALMLLAWAFTRAIIAGMRDGVTYVPMSVVFHGRTERGQKRYFAVMLFNCVAATLLWIGGLALFTRGLI